MGDEKDPEARIGAEPDRRTQGLEVATFLFLVVPSMLLALFVVRQGSVGFGLAAVASILRDLSLVALILFFAWRNGEPLARFGWVFRGRTPDVVLGILLFPLLFFAFGLLDRTLEGLGLSGPATPLPGFLKAVGPGDAVLAVVLVSVVAVAEETIFRGYLIRRLHAVTGSQATAVVLSCVIFSVGHGYEGTAGVVTVGCMGLVFALLYLWRRSLVLPIVLHFLQDAVAIVLPALLGLR